MNEGQIRALLSKLPEFLPGWNPEVQASWFKVFDRVVTLVEKHNRANIVPDTTGAELTHPPTPPAAEARRTE